MTTPAPTTVTLREMRAEDEDVVYRTLTELETWELRSPRAPRPVSRAQFSAQLAQREEDETSVQFVIDRDDRAVGRCSLFGVDTLAHRAEVGISLIADARGRGTGTEALRQLVAFGFERWNLHRLHLEVISSNAAAIASYLRVGFVQEGRLREHVWIRGRWEDEILMGLLRSQWRSGL